MTAQMIGIVLIILAVAIGVLMIIFRNTFVVKITWKYALILLPALLIIAALLLSRKKPVPGTNPDPGTGAVNQALSDIKEKMREANTIAIIEVTAAREQNKNKLDQLKRISNIDNDVERRKQLAELIG